mmetsp:Transcript_31483/g.70507  ORF Transcript_31483/g.70507 Transcript_31483/m.70507 type:complete len:218 (+) Transcript_31483:223-876(+)
MTRLKWLLARAAVLLVACDSTYSFQPTRISCRSLASSGRSLESRCTRGRQQTRLRLAVKSSLTYVGVINLLYITRRSCVRDMSKRKLFRIRITREDGVSTRFYLTNLLAWQLFVTFVWPVSEPLSRILGYVSFYYSYPNASGVGMIFEPINVQHLSMAKRTKKQLRVDWHQFAYNIGDIGREGYRHPPSVTRNLPHLDAPSHGMKHWPWRRRFRANR